MLFEVKLEHAWIVLGGRHCANIFTSSCDTVRLAIDSTMQRRKFQRIFHFVGEPFPKHRY